ncbi:MAG: hypothetical protein LBV41_04525 [Cytophagaceae bacterium]|nr:hypothetical protein [Cytophagaceae bacterium]
MPAQRSLRQTDNSTAARKGRTCTFTPVLPLRAGRYERHFPQATLRFDTLTGSVTEAVVEPVETQRPARRCGYEDLAFSRLFCEI